MTSAVLAPAVIFMGRLRLLPKFMAVTLVFMLPLLLVSSLLIMQLQKSVAFAQAERSGVSQLRQVQTLIRKNQQFRALQHMALSGNAAAGSRAATMHGEIANEMKEFDETLKAADPLGVTSAWRELKQHWDSLPAKLADANARTRYAEYTHVIARLYRFNSLVADRANLNLDPELDTYYLTALYVKTFPEIAEGLAEIAGRGAAYIDTGLIEANEDVLLASTLMVARRDLARVPGQLESMYRQRPELEAKLASSLAVLPAADAFLQRAGNEVLNSVDQTSGTQFYEAGAAAVDALYATAATSANLLDQLLQERIARDVAQRDMMGGGVLVALAAAAYLLAGFYLSFKSGVRKLTEAVQRVASGDLVVRVHATGRDEIAELTNAFSTMGSDLARLVAQVRSGTQTIAVASDEIASGNLDLSSRTEEQASSLEQTAAAMAQLNASVKDNTAHAEQASALAVSASEQVREGGAMVARVADTMAAIGSSAQEIGQIVGVIDAIAFQTNILALNAAVEAAHAGVHGRGFAVVAAEVRNLAQRAADAAREIRSLIADSAVKVERGGVEVGHAGETMQQVVGVVARLSLLMQDISTASHDQQGGIEEVNMAIGQIENLTQQNAALVEEAAAAAESMRTQTAGLSQAMMAFRLADEAVVLPENPMQVLAANSDNRHLRHSEESRPIRLTAALRRA